MSASSPAEAVRVVLVDDHAMFRAGVRAELAAAGAGRVEVSGRRPTPTPPSRSSTSCSPRSCCSTCTCPAVAGSR